jgi:putative ABC transport system permease protein
VHSAFLHAWRSWKSAKAIALLAIVAFAVGIGSTTAIYTVVNTVMLDPLPYPNGERFVTLYGARFSEPGQRASNTFPDLQEYQRLTTSFDMFGWFRMSEFNLTAPGEPQHVSVAAVTPSLAHNLGVSPAVGRWFTDETGAVLSNALWRRLGADPQIVGKGITLDGRRLTVAGVMPPGFRLPVSGPGTDGFHSDVWIHLDQLGRGQNSGEALYFTYARRKPGVTVAQADAEVKRVAAEIAKRDPASHPSYTARLEDLAAASVSEIRPTLLLLFAAAGLLLLITCANVAGLLLARSVARARETATRVALGASRGQLALQYFVEGLFVSLAGAAAGVVLSAGLVRLVVAIAAEYVPRADEIAVDWDVLVFALGTAFLTSVLCSLAPLWQAARTSPTEVLSAGVRASAGARVRRLSQSLVIGEIALAFTLLAVSAVSIAHLRALVRTSPGFDPEGLLTFHITIADAVASRDETRAPFQKRLVEAVEAIPGVTNAALTSELPLDGCCMVVTVYPEGRTITRIPWREPAT